MREELWRRCGVVIWNALEEEVSRLVLRWPLTLDHSGSLTTEEWEVSTPAEFWLTNSLQGFISSKGLKCNICNDETWPDEVDYSGIFIITSFLEITTPIALKSLSYIIFPAHDSEIFTLPNTVCYLSPKEYKLLESL